MTADNFIDIIKAAAYNMEVDLDKLAITIEDEDGWPHSINGYHQIDYTMSSEHRGELFLSLKPFDYEVN